MFRAPPSLHDGVLNERRGGIRLQEGAVPFEQAFVPDGGIEIKFRTPGSGIVRIAPPAVPDRGQVSLKRVPVRRAFAQRDRINQSVAEADVADPRFAVDVDEENEVIADNRVAADVARDAACQKLNVETDRTQRLAQEAVHLIAPAAAVPRHDLFKNSFRVAGDGGPKLNVQVFVGDILCVGAMQRLEGGEIAPHAAVVTDALEIILKLHVRRPFPSTAPVVDFKPERERRRIKKGNLR